MFNAFVQECAGAIFAKLSAETLGLVSVGVSAGGLVATMLHILLIAVNADELTLGFISLLVGTMVSLGLIPMTYGLTKNSYFRSFKTSLTHQEQISHRISLTQDKDVCLSAWKYYLTLLITLTSTLMIAPTVTHLVEPQNPDKDSVWKTRYFMPVSCYLVYYVFEIVGKETANITCEKMVGFVWWTSQKGQWTLLIASVARIAIIPLLLFCNIAPRTRSPEMPVVFGSVGWYIFFNAFFALTKGYIQNIAFMYAPKVVGKDSQELASAFAMMVTLIGRAIGSLLALTLVKPLFGFRLKSF